MARKHSIVGVLLAGMLLTYPCRGAVDAPFPELLAQADTVRSANPEEFSRLIGVMEQRELDATDSEQRHLRLLQVYEHVMRGRYDDALDYAKVLFNTAPETELKFRAGLLAANAAAVMRDFTLAMRYLELSLALEPSVESREVRHLGYGAAAAMYNEFGQHALARHYAELMLGDEPTPRNRCAARHFQIDALEGMDIGVGDDGFVQSAIEDCASQREAIFSNLIRKTLAARWAKAGKHEQALMLLRGSLPEVEATKYPLLIGWVRALVAKYELENGSVGEAEAQALKVLELPGQDPTSVPMIIVHNVLYQAAVRRQDWKTALDEYRLYAKAEKARLDEVKAREYGFQIVRHELKQKSQSIELLSNQNRLLKLEQEVASKNAWNSRLAIALLCVIALSLGFWGLRGRRMHRTMRQLAQTDSLTGLSNRRHFRERSEEILTQAAARGRPVSVLLFDLDHFKQINDQCSHAVGDWVLREVARVGRLLCREGDLFGRIGGEEFALTLVDCDVQDARAMAEEFREAIARIDGAASGCTLPVSASVGCVGTSISGYSYELLIAHADAAMYHSKVGGRNRVSVYERPTRRAEEAETPGVREVRALLARH